MSILGQIIGPATEILDKVIVDKDQKAKMAHELATMADKHAQQALLGQLEINKAEAQSTSFFKSSWRPAIGWTCALAFFYHYILQPLITFTVAISGAEIPPLPAFDMSTLLPVLGGMLGIGGLRTYEKQKGLTK